MFITDIECVVQLGSIPQNVSVVNPGTSITFICNTTGSTTIAWSSIEYIDRGGSQITFLSINSPGTIENISTSDNFANLTMVDGANLVLQSQLHLMNVTVSSTVICYSNDHGTSASITFRVGKKFIIPKYTHCILITRCYQDCVGYQLF